jgi:phage terminase small subunit
MDDLNAKQQAFVQEYLISRNGSQAYIRAGYRVKNADVAKSAAARLLTNVNVAAAVAQGQKAAQERAEIKLDDVIKQLWHIATVDRTAITAYRIGACRYCWGIEHHYQWKTPREYSEAIEQHILKGEAYQANHPAPEQEGGYGYNITRAPYPGCPECNGLGTPYTRFLDTDLMTPEQRVIFNGVKKTTTGLQYMLADRIKALEALGKHFGLSGKKRDEATSSLSQALADIASRGSTMPIAEPASASVASFDTGGEDYDAFLAGRGAESDEGIEVHDAQKAFIIKQGSSRATLPRR